MLTALLRRTSPRASLSGQEEERPRAPKFFEVFGDTLTEVVFLRNLVIVLAGGCLVLTLAVLRLANKPPLVIRVDNVNDPTAISNIRAESQVTGHEVRNFAEHFTRYIWGWDLYTLDDDIKRGLAMMTEQGALKMKRRLDQLEAGPKVKADALRTKVVISEISVEKDSSQVIRVQVRGMRLAESFEKSDFRKEIVFEDVLTIRKVERSLKTPWGLLVEDVSERIFKETP